jgi:hypothetical protein
MALILAVLLVLGSTDADRTLKVIPSKTLPAIESIAIYPSASIKPGKEKPKPLALMKLKNDTIARLGEGPFHIYAKPKDGIEVLVAEKLTIKAGETHELKLDDLLGVVEVFQKDGFPKVDRLVLTAPDDAGPDEKGHVPVQIGSDYRVEMPAPEGFYAVWLVPANGARAQRIEDRIRVLPGKVVRIGN